MLAVFTFLLGVAEVDPNLILAAGLGATGSIWTGMITQRGARGSLARIEQKLDHLETRVDNLYVPSAMRASDSDDVGASQA
jgi:hypothetical protein